MVANALVTFFARSSKLPAQPTQKSTSGCTPLAVHSFIVLILKSIVLFIRPIRHWNPERVKGHVFVSTLSYLIRWQAWHDFTEFLDRDDNDENRCEAGSLRGVWDKLHKITIGKITVKGESFEQISPLTNIQKRILDAANAKFDKSAKEYLRVVG